jgi:SAM-dependent methyltransferase
MTPAWQSRPSCPACGNSHRKIVADLPHDAPPLSTYLHTFYTPAVHPTLAGLEGGRHVVARCAGCGSHYQVMVPGEEWLGAFYGALPAMDRERQPTFVFAQRSRELVMLVEWCESRGAPLRALDFGAGRGDWARLAAAAGLEVTVMDVATDAFPSLRAAGIHCELPFGGPADRFGLIHAEQVLEHLPDPAGTVARLANLLAQGGILALGVPRDDGLDEKLRAPDWLAPKHSPASLNAVAPLEHLNAFTPSGLELLGKRHGLARVLPHGWSLLPEAPSLRAGLRQFLRRRLRLEYHEAMALTQTQFFTRP